MSAWPSIIWTARRSAPCSSMWLAWCLELAAARKLQRMIDELFELSRVGIQANPPEEVALGELVREALSELAGKVTERGVEVEVAPDLPALEAKLEAAGVPWTPGRPVPE